MSPADIERSQPYTNGLSANGSSPQPHPQASNFRIVHRVLDWITNDRMQFINITDRINEVVRKSGIQDGLVHLQSLHTTASVFINEWQDALTHDVRSFFDQFAAREAYYRHNDPNYSDCERQNADSHLRGLVMGPTLCLQVRNSAVLLGTWQNIVLAEFDGPRSRSMSIQVQGI